KRVNGRSAKIQRSGAEFTEFTLRSQRAEVHREIGIFHLAPKRVLQRVGGASSVKGDVRMFENRRKKRETVDVVPMEMTKQDMDLTATESFMHEFLSQQTDTASCIQDQNFIIRKAHFHARSIASIAQIPSLWRGERTSNAPELHFKP